METIFIGIAAVLGLYLLYYVVLRLWFLYKECVIPKFVFCGLRSKKRVEKRTIGFMKRIMLLLICIMIPALSYADVKDVIRAISEGSNLNIKLEGLETEAYGEVIGDGLVALNFTPNGFDFNDNRVFGINADDLDLNYRGRKIISKKYVNEVDRGNLYTYAFFIVDTDSQPRFAFGFLDSGVAFPMLFFDDGKDNKRFFDIKFCSVIGADGSILLPRIPVFGSDGCETLKAILESIAKTVDLEE